MLSWSFWPRMMAFVRTILQRPSFEYVVEWTLDTVHEAIPPPTTKINGILTFGKNLLNKTGPLNVPLSSHSLIVTKQIYRF